MTLSARYRALGPRVSKLCRHMLPQQTAIGLYSDRQYDRVRGFIVLAHAEVEYSIEKLAEEALLAAHSGYISDGRMRPCLVSLVAWVPTKIRPPTWATWSVRRREAWAVNHYLKQVLPFNNGASRRHILRLIGPLGILEPTLDNAWLVLADGIFVRRGQVAHTGVAAQNDPNPSDERRDMRALVFGLRDIDKLLTSAST